MLVESITLKLAVDLFNVLYKNKIEVSSIKLITFDGKHRRFLQFDSFSELNSYYVSNYKNNIRFCELGKFVSITEFKAESNLYNFTTKYHAIDVCSDFELYKGKDFDNKRSINMSKQLDTQYTKIIDTINKYKKHCVTLRNIYKNGIYSQCYAEPGWSEGTGQLKYYRDVLLNSGNINIFEIN